MPDLYDTIARFTILALVLVFLACPICTAIVAANKQRDVALWFVLGLIFGPFGLLAAIGVPTYDREAARAYAGRPSSKQVCPCCDETVSVNAAICRYCGCDLPVGDNPEAA